MSDKSERGLGCLRKVGRVQQVLAWRFRRSVARSSPDQGSDVHLVARFALKVVVDSVLYGRLGRYSGSLRVVF